MNVNDHSTAHLLIKRRALNNLTLRSKAMAACDSNDRRHTHDCCESRNCAVIASYYWNILLF